MRIKRTLGKLSIPLLSILIAMLAGSLWIVPLMYGDI